MDSCTIAPDEVREIVNRGNDVCKMLVVIPYPPGAQAMSGAPTDPHALFSVEGKVALVTGASGAFGAVAAETLASAGAKLVLAAGKAKELAEVAAECRARGAEVEEIVGRPYERGRLRRRSSPRPSRASAGVDILVVASGKNDVVEDRRHGAGAVPRRDGRQCHAELADRARRGQADARARARAARSS